MSFSPELERQASLGYACTIIESVDVKARLEAISSYPTHACLGKRKFDAFSFRTP